jgi:hypothetical protein
MGLFSFGCVVWLELGPPVALDRCVRPARGEGKVNSGGRTSWLWIKPIFGFCGELWLIFGFAGDRFGFRRISQGFWPENRGENVVEVWFFRGDLCGSGARVEGVVSSSTFLRGLSPGAGLLVPASAFRVKTRSQIVRHVRRRHVSGTAHGALVLMIRDAAGPQNEIRYLNATAVMDI